MSHPVFTYNNESALSVGQGGFITETGSYVVTITEAKYTTSAGGAKSIEFSVEADDGRKANYLSVWYKKKDGTPNSFGESVIHAIMGCARVRNLTLHMKDINTEIAPELTGKRIGLVLQKVLKSKSDGTDTYSLEIKMPYIADTGQTLLEHSKGEQAAAISRMLTTLKDRDDRQHHASASHINQPSQSNDGFDDIPF